MVDYVAGVLELLGTWKVGNKNKIGFILLIVGGIFWIITAFKTKVYGLLIVVSPAICINIRNFIRWNKQDKEKIK